MADYFATIARLVDYEVRCNIQAVDFLGSLNAADLRRDFGFGLRTPHRTMWHIAEVMRGWSGCVAAVQVLPTWNDYDGAVPLSTLRTTLTEVGAAWRQAALESHEQDLLHHDGRLGHLFHLVTHGHHHRGQLLSMVTLMGFAQPFEGGDFGGWHEHDHD